MDGPSEVATAIREARAISIPDLKDTDLYRQDLAVRRQLVDEEGARSWLVVPLLRDGAGVGSITLARREVRPFSDDEIALVETFAAQAVIAIDNATHFRDLQARLKREQAAGEVLDIISRSRSDEYPVFQTLLRHAGILCDAETCALMLGRPDGPGLRMVAYHVLNGSPTDAQSAALESIRNSVMELDPAQHVSAQAICSGAAVHVGDLSHHPSYLAREPSFVTMVEVNHERTVLSVPLMGAGGAIGAINLHRKRVAPFTADEIALVETFAAQAVIAIENVRQFREVQARTREVEQALEHQMATSEVLGVISRSTNDLQPVLDTIVATAARLCRATHAVMFMLRDGLYHLAASNNADDVLIRYARDHPHLPGRDTVAGRAALERKTVHLEDCLADADYRGIEYQRVGNYRTTLGVPILRDGQAIGVMTLLRPRVEPFSEREIELVETFADQAVIAIENARLFTALETLNAQLGERVTEQVGEIERMGRLRRFLSPAVADAVVSSGNESMLSSHRALIAVMFCDIRGFTAFCERAEPEETIEVLQTYHEAMGRLIGEHGGGVDHRWGDGIMVIFNDPLPCDDPAGDALRLAFAMRDRMAGLCAGWRRMGHRLGFGVGLSLGYATVGMVGSDGRFDYTASGTAVNLAARLCDIAADGEILLSPRAHIAVEDQVEAESVGETAFKGIQAPVEVFRALALKSPRNAEPG